MGWFRKKKKNDVSSQSKEAKSFNAGKKWSEEEDQTLLRALKEGVEADQISATLGRSSGSVRSRWNYFEKERRSGSWTPLETFILISYWNNEGFVLEKASQILDRKHTSIKGKLIRCPNYPNAIPLQEAISKEEATKILKIIIKAQEKGLRTEQGEKIIPKDITFKTDKPIEEWGEVELEAAKLCVSFKRHETLEEEIKELEKEITDYTEKTSNDIRSYAEKGFEIEAISLIVDIPSNKVSEIIENQGFYEEYDKIMLKIAEERLYAAPLKAGNREKDWLEERDLNKKKEQEKMVSACLRLIESSEQTTVEFKQSFRTPTKGDNAIKGNTDENVIHSTLKNVNAFLNTSGGDILIGVVDNSKEKVGIEYDRFKNQDRMDDEWYRRTIHEKISQTMGSEVADHFIKIHLVKMESKKNGEVDICRISVAQSDKPVFIKNPKFTSEGRKKMQQDFPDLASKAFDKLFYIRRQDKAETLDIEELLLYLQRNFPNYNSNPDI